MARGVSLEAMLEQLRAETRRSLNPAHNNQTRDPDVILLRNKQQELWEEFDWPHLRNQYTVQLQAGQRVYGMPSGLLVNRITETIEVKFGGVWVPLRYGIEPADYSNYDSDLDERSWPVEAWEIKGEQIEVWPIPSDTGVSSDLEGYLRITGIRNLAPLVANSDVCEIDHLAIVWSVAAEQLAAAGAKDAQAKFDRARARLAKLKGDLTPRKTFKLFGEPRRGGRELRGPPRVYYRTTS